MDVRDVRSAKISCINRIIILLGRYDYSALNPEDRVKMRIFNDSKRQFLEKLVPPANWNEPSFEIRDLYMLEKLINRTTAFQDLVAFSRHKEELIRKYCEIGLKYKFY